MLSETQLLTRLSTWYSEQCNGLWEHGSGIAIDTLDNPGWIVRINLRETPLQEAPFAPVKINKSENDWIECHINDSVFQGAGDPSKLATILEIFLQFAGK